MRKKIPLAYFFIFFSLLGVMSLPKESTEKLRGTSIAFLAPAWEKLISLKSFFYRSSSTHLQSANSTSSQEDLEKLRLENKLLQSEISHLKDLMQNELRLLSQITSAMPAKEAQYTASLLKKRHRIELQKLLQMQLQSVPARVIFRSPSSWNSSLWIDVGYSTNEKLGNQVVAKNSPVLIGTSVIGVIDYVGYKQARVRLITDSGLTPSVRALREPSENHLATEKIQSILQLLEKKKGIFQQPQEQGDFISTLNHAIQRLSKDDSCSYLAKGELHGTSKPLWRTQRHQLQGIGFNYDYADGEGPPRDLRTGKLTDPSSEIAAIPILKKGDLLITTGMDGIFPADLLVAEVTHVHMLKEGDYFYELDALPTAGNLDDLTFVFVIPPVGYDPDEQPLPVGWSVGTSTES